MTDFFSTKFNSYDSFHLAQDDVVGNATSSFIIIYDLWLFIDFCRQILLRQSFGLASLLNIASDVSINRFVFQFFSLTIQFCGVSGWRMLFVGTSVD